MSGLAKTGLSNTQVRKAGAEARIFLGNDPPIWKDLGDDEQNAQMSKYLDHLRETKNSAMADQLEPHSELLRQFLRNQTKAIRNKSGRICSRQSEPKT